MTLNELERPIRIWCRKDASFGAHAQHKFE